MSARLVTLLACTAALVGCGQLRVKVDVLDPQYVRGEIGDEALRKTYRRILAASPGDLANQVVANYRVYQREVEELAKRYETLAKSFPEAQARSLVASANDLRQAASGGSILEGVMRQASVIEDKAQEVREAAATSRWTGRGPLPETIRAKLVELDAESKKLAVIQQKDLRELAIDSRRIAARAAQAPGAPASPAPRQQADAALKAAEAQERIVQAVAQRSIAQGSELTHTEYAYVVASAKPELWSEKYNEAVGSGTFGNVDVVIRMNSTADFSVKGMRFDASTVAQVASKVLTQSLLVGAQMAGVPVAAASAGTSSGGDALSKSSADLASLEQTLTNRQALTDAQRSAIRAAARAILGVAPQLETGDLKTKPKNDDARATLHESVLSTFNALKPQLELQGLQ